MIFSTIDYQVDDDIAHIILKRPNQLNAVNSLMSKELPEMWKMFNEDNSAIVAIISGFGDKSFCVGADLADLPDMDGDAGMASLESIKWTSLQNNIWKPVICAVNGIACGGGLHFVADSDIVIASDNATFFDTHVKVGLVAGLEPVSLSRKIPLERVLRMSLIGGAEKIDANEAKSIGLISEITKNEKDEVILKVIDEGKGFKEKSTKKIFDRFYSNRPDKFGEHSGLGLNIVKNLVDVHEGEILASNRLDKDGAIVEIRFPSV